MIKRKKTIVKVLQKRLILIISKHDRHSFQSANSVTRLPDHSLISFVVPTDEGGDGAMDGGGESGSVKEISP